MGDIGKVSLFWILRRGVRHLSWSSLVKDSTHFFHARINGYCIGLRSAPPIAISTSRSTFEGSDPIRKQPWLTSQENLREHGEPRWFLTGEENRNSSPLIEPERMGDAKNLSGVFGDVMFSIGRNDVVEVDASFRLMSTLLNLESWCCRFRSKAHLMSSILFSWMFIAGLSSIMRESWGGGELEVE